MPEVRLIDANAFAAQYGDYYAEEGPEEGFIGTVGELIAKQPTIEAEPVRHGRWVSEKVRKPNWKGVEHDYFQPNSCSVCHTGFSVRTNFCPNCGARIDGGAENG